MKINIRGLVFTGFAAAVFAQSAVAIDLDDKTVTSKTYVDNYAQAQADRVMSTNVQSSDWQSDEKYPSMKLLSQSGLADAQPKAETLVDSTTNELEQNAAWIGWHNGDNGENADWVKLQGDGYTEIVHTVGKGHLVKLDSNKIADDGSDIWNNGAGPASGDYDDLTTAKAVYDVLTGAVGNGFQRKINETEGGILKDQYHMDINGVTGNSAVEIGYKPYNSSTQEYGDSTWGVLKPAADSNDGPGQGYIVFQKDTSKLSWDVNINPAKVASAGSDVGTAGGGSASHAQKGKLATAYAVYDYAVQKDWTSANAGKHLVVGQNGIVTLSENVSPDIPAPTDSRCIGANSTHVCALVAYWVAASTDPETGDPIPAGVKYEWTVMAPTGA